MSRWRSVPRPLRSQTSSGRVSSSVARPPYSSAHGARASRSPARTLAARRTCGSNPAPNSRLGVARIDVHDMVEPERLPPTRGRRTGPSARSSLAMWCDGSRTLTFHRGDRRAALPDAPDNLVPEVRSDGFEIAGRHGMRLVDPAHVSTTLETALGTTAERAARQLHRRLDHQRPRHHLVRPAANCGRENLSTRRAGYRSLTCVGVVSDR